VPIASPSRTFAPLNPPQRLLLGPGPSDVHPRVLAAMTLPLLGHLDPAFVAMMDETKEMLRYVFQTKNPMTLALPGTGSSGMESAFVNLIEPGDSVLICVVGYFGERMVDMTERLGAKVHVIEKPYGEAFDPSEVRDAVKKHAPKVVGIVHAETSSGVLQPLEEIVKIVHEAGALIVVDAVTSLGCVPVMTDEWGLDVVFSCTQKGLSCPPGMAPISFSPKAVETIHARKTKVPNWYLDVSLLSKYWGSDRAYHHTAPISMAYALREGLSLVIEETLEARFARHVRNQKALKAGLQALGLTYVAAEGFQVPAVHAVRIPDGIDDLTIRKRLLNDMGIEIGGGLGSLKGKAWRIGLMGQGSKERNVLLLLGALEVCLRDAGCSLKPGAALEAAGAAYAG